MLNHKDHLYTLAPSLSGHCHYGFLLWRWRIKMATRPVSLERRTEKLDVRVSRSAKTKLQAAAAASHRSMSDFVMESALSRAEETLAERRIFALDKGKRTAFQAALDAPPRSLPRLQTLLDEPGFFDSGSGRSVDAVRHWESGRRSPEAAARALLLVIAHDSQTFMRVLAQSQPAEPGSARAVKTLTPRGKKTRTSMALAG
jgi:uncharacterized protein (DUF1778 family)